MKKISSISLEYGDAVLRIYYIHLNALKNSGAARADGIHEHRYYELHFAKSGTHHYEMDHRLLTLKEREMLIIPPNVLHRSSLGGQKVVLEFSLSRGTGRVGFYAYFKETLNQMAKQPIPVSAELLRHLSQIKHAEVGDDLRDYCLLKAQASALIYELFVALNGFSFHGIRTVEENRREENLILLESLVNQPGRSLKEISEIINYSERHTARLIRQMYHMSLSELRRIRGKELLCDYNETKESENKTQNESI